MLPRLLRPCDWLALAYFAYTSLLSVTLPVAPAVTSRVLITNLAVALFLLARHALRKPWQQVLHNFLMLSLLLVGYQEMGWFALPRHGSALEQAWVVWDRYLLDTLRLRALIESAGWLIPIILEISYSLVYTIGSIALALLYYYRRGEQVPRFLCCLFAGTFLAYALFPFFPSEPPRTVFPETDLPSYQSAFRGFNYWLLGNWGIHTSVFPSAHVSSAFAAAFALRRLLPEPRWVWRATAVLASLIALSTIYGRYHYAVDALAGFAIAAVSVPVTLRMLKNS